VFIQKNTPRNNIFMVALVRVTSSIKRVVAGSSPVMTLAGHEAQLEEHYVSLTPQFPMKQKSDGV
jgi:hypothetical protein